MGYYTKFTGSINIDPPLEKDMETYLTRFFKTRHFVRNKAKIFDVLKENGLTMESFTPPGTTDCGELGEFFADESRLTMEDFTSPGTTGDLLTDALEHLKNRIGDLVSFEDCFTEQRDYNETPRSIPSLWCNFELKGNDQLVLLDGRNYEYVAWLEFLVNKLLKPRGYTLNGRVEFDGERADDKGYISVTDNVIGIHGNCFFEHEEFGKIVKGGHPYRCS